MHTQLRYGSGCHFRVGAEEVGCSFEVMTSGLMCGRVRTHSSVLLGEDGSDEADEAGDGAQYYILNGGE